MRLPDAQEILSLAHNAGFQQSRVTAVADIFNLIGRRGNPSLENKLQKAFTYLLKDFPNPLLNCSLLVSALSYHHEEREDFSTADDPHTLIAAFARRNYYREAVNRMKYIVQQLKAKTGASKHSFRIFCNSHLPEKLLAAFCGLGFYGKNSLLITQGLGSRFIIAVLLFPLRISASREKVQIVAPGVRCAECQACRDACPTKALQIPGEVDITRCLQQLSTELILFPDEIKKTWGYRLYGCESCQNACPYNNGLTQTTVTDCGILGPSISIARLLTLSSQELKNHFKKTALGMSWINPLALQRNTLLAAGNRKNSVLMPYVEPFLRHENPVLRDAGRWALEMIHS